MYISDALGVTEWIFHSWSLLQGTLSPAQLTQGLGGGGRQYPWELIAHILHPCWEALSFKHLPCIFILFELHSGQKGSSFDGDLTSGTEPFCGRFSLCQPQHLVLTPPATQQGYRLDQYPQVQNSPHASRAALVFLSGVKMKKQKVKRVIAVFPVICLTRFWLSFSVS